MKELVANAERAGETGANGVRAFSTIANVETRAERDHRIPGRDCPCASICFKTGLDFSPGRRITVR